MPWYACQAYGPGALVKTWPALAWDLGTAGCHDSPGWQSVRCEDKVSHRGGGSDSSMPRTARVEPHVSRPSIGIRLAQDPRARAGATEDEPLAGMHITSSPGASLLGETR